MYVCVYVVMYIYVRKCLYIGVLTSMHLCMYEMYACICMSVCYYLFMYMYVCVHMYVCVCMYVLTCVCTSNLHDILNDVTQDIDNNNYFDLISIDFS